MDAIPQVIVDGGRVGDQLGQRAQGGDLVKDCHYHLLLTVSPVKIRAYRITVACICQGSRAIEVLDAWL
jgi:hypothetical protein